MSFKNDPGLLLYLPFYELYGSSFMSRDTYGHLFTVNGALWQPNGRSFDGTDDSIVQTTLFDVMPSTNALTLIVWVKPTGGTGAVRTIINKNNIALQDRLNLEIRDDEKIRFWTEGGNNGVKQVNSAVISPTTDTFSHIAGIYETGKALRLYLNTTESSGGTADTILDGTANDFSIGELPAAAQPFTGVIGEIWAYNRVLTPQEIQHNYLATKWRYR